MKEKSNQGDLTQEKWAKQDSKNILNKTMPKLL